jgi:peptidoglycan/xylan/chitin deacetylase (PgdA/CDA1 family)
VRAILTYHSLDDSGSAISVPPVVFSQHVRWMRESGIRVLPLGDLVALDDEDSSPAIAITFDDGFTTFIRAAEELIGAGLPVTLFIVTGHVSGSNAWGGRTQAGIPTLPLLGWTEIERLVARGVRLGAHTRTHPRLTALPTSAIEDELDGCRHDIQHRLGVGVEHFAYPYGAVDSRVAAIAGTRFQAAFTTRFSPLRRRDGAMWIPRLDMYYMRRPGAIESWGTPRFRRRLWSVHLRRQLRRALT